jgi:class 3 adenylate cyclase
LVSVLFADLVGFTTLSESRDAEDVRELLSEYFESCRTVIARYGGVVEKFIGDAVMAVWGTPTAREDDAERAVRAALQLTETVLELGERIGAEGLRARAGVLTGEAAVNLAAEGQGMVAGDLVNTASRIQAAASPGSVLVGEATKRATEASIAYSFVGAKELKGKSEPVSLYQALRVVAAAGGGQRSVGLEAPFVGRDRELRIIKDLLHASIDEGIAQHVTVIGPAGIGKSRIVWELFKYIDGLAQNVRWHRGRCLAYGEGVAYWPLAEMVRTNAAILEGEDPATALPKLQAAVAEAVSDPEERRWIEPRLASLLGLEAGVARQRDDLFSAWRLFYERLAEQMPTVMIFEDIHWADPSLLDFVEYLLERTRDRSIFILSLTRPDLFERRPGWGAGKRSTTSIHLEPLPLATMDELLGGLAPGLPSDLEAQVLERAEGVPLYAVETVRMLLDRGLLQRGDDGYSPTDEVGALEVPETLHALIASRLDGLSPRERGAIQDGAVLGKTFSRQALAALSPMPADELDETLDALVRKELLAVQADRLSPERGQYGFLGDLVRRVAYETLPKKERKAKHLAAAAYLEAGFEEEDLIEVIASHLLQAYEASPEADDASWIKTRVRDALRRAGERAASLAAGEEAQRFFSQAADLAGDPAEEAEILERAGLAARFAGDVRVAVDRFQRSVAKFEEAGLSHPAARVSARLGEAMWDLGKLAEARDMMARSLALLADEPPDEDLATLTAQLGRIEYFAGNADEALARIEEATDMAERLSLPGILSAALNTKGAILNTNERHHEGYALLKYSLELALEHDLPAEALRAYYNISELDARSDRYSEARDSIEQGLSLARRIGNRQWEWNFLSQTYPLYALGEWDRMFEMLDDIPPEKLSENRLVMMSSVTLKSLVLLNRGERLDLTELLGTFDPGSTADVQEQASYHEARAIESLAEGDLREGLRCAERALEWSAQMGFGSEFTKEAFRLACECAFDLGNLQRVNEFVDGLESRQPGMRLPSMDALALRFRGRLAALDGDWAGADRFLKQAVGLYRELGMVSSWAQVLLEHAEILNASGRAVEAVSLVDDARDIFERLGARPWLERLAQTGTRVKAPT